MSIVLIIISCDKIILGTDSKATTRGSDRSSIVSKIFKSGRYFFSLCGVVHLKGFNPAKIVHNHLTNSMDFQTAISNIKQDIHSKALRALRIMKNESS